MNLKHSILPAVLALSTVSSANALTVQVDFAGVVTYSSDLLGNVFTAPVSVGDIVVGRFIYDDQFVASLANVTPSSSFAGLDSAPPSWMTSYLTVGSTSFSPHTIPDFAYVPEYEYNADQINVINSGTDSAKISDGYTKYRFNPAGYYDGSSQLSVQGYDPTGASLSGGSFADLLAAPSILTAFYFSDYLQSFTGENVEYFRAASISGDITSIVVSRIDQPATVPVPTSLMLLASALASLGLARRRDRHRLTC